MKALNFVIGRMKTNLRERQGETIWRTSEISGMRQETIKALESCGDSPLLGSAESLNRYVSSFVARFPQEGYKIFYDLCIQITQGRVQP